MREGGKAHRNTEKIQRKTQKTEEDTEDTDDAEKHSGWGEEGVWGKVKNIEKQGKHRKIQKNKERPETQK